MTVGKTFNAGSCCIGKTVFDFANQSADNIKRTAEEKCQAAKVALLEKINKATQIQQLGKPYEKLTNKELIIMIAQLKKDGDMKTPFKMMI